VIKPADTIPARASSSEAKPNVVDPPVPPKSSPTTAVSNTSAPSPIGSEYSVQVAAYNHKPDAQKLASSLVKRGYQARVDGDTIPFRVRIGRYSTASDAEKALVKIKAKHMTGFVVRAPER
jgi:cell division septation protein DedD